MKKLLATAVNNPMNTKEVNYCGYGKSVLIKPPHWALFNASCKIHDDNYKAGTTKEEKLEADLGFLWRMLQDINQQTDYKKKRTAARTAIIYYALVRVFGILSFNWRRK